MQGYQDVRLKDKQLDGTWKALTTSTLTAPCTRKNIEKLEVGGRGVVPVGRRDVPSGQWIGL